MTTNFSNSNEKHGSLSVDDDDDGNGDRADYESHNNHDHSTATKDWSRSQIINDETTQHEQLWTWDAFKKSSAIQPALQPAISFTNFRSKSHETTALNEWRTLLRTLKPRNVQNVLVLYGIAIIWINQEQIAPNNGVTALDKFSVVLMAHVARHFIQLASELDMVNNPVQFTQYGLVVLRAYQMFMSLDQLAIELNVCDKKYNKLVHTIEQTNEACEALRIRCEQLQTANNKLQKENKALQKKAANSSTPVAVTTVVTQPPIAVVVPPITVDAASSTTEDIVPILPVVTTTPKVSIASVVSKPYYEHEEVTRILELASATHAKNVVSHADDDDVGVQATTKKAKISNTVAKPTSTSAVQTDDEEREKKHIKKRKKASKEWTFTPTFVCPKCNQTNFESVEQARKHMRDTHFLKWFGKNVEKAVFCEVATCTYAHINPSLYDPHRRAEHSLVYDYFCNIESCEQYAPANSKPEERLSVRSYPTEESLHRHCVCNTSKATHMQGEYPYGPKK